MLFSKVFAPIAFVTIFALSVLTLQPKALADVTITQFCFDLLNPANSDSVQILNADDDPYINQEIGSMSFTIDYRENATDPWINVGSVDYLMVTDASGFLVDNGGTHTADFGGPISNAGQIQISMSVNAQEWQASGLDPWALDNVVLKNGTDQVIAWDYSTDANASFFDPAISSAGGLGDAWGGDLTSATVTGGVYEFTFPEGGGGGGGFIYDVTAVPEPGNMVFLGLASLTCLRRRR